MVVATIELHFASFSRVPENENCAYADKIPRPITKIRPIFFRSFMLSCHINVAGNTAKIKSVITLIAGRISKNASSQDEHETYTLGNRSNTLEPEDSNNHLQYHDSIEH